MAVDRSALAGGPFNKAAKRKTWFQRKGNGSGWQSYVKAAPILWECDDVPALKHVHTPLPPIPETTDDVDKVLVVSSFLLGADGQRSVVSPFQLGDVVIIFGLKSTELNGKQGKIVKIDTIRAGVLISGCPAPKLIKYANLGHFDPLPSGSEEDELVSMGCVSEGDCFGSHSGRPDDD